MRNTYTYLNFGFIELSSYESQKSYGSDRCRERLSFLVLQTSGKIGMNVGHFQGYSGLLKPQEGRGCVAVCLLLATRKSQTTGKCPLCHPQTGVTNLQKPWDKCLAVQLGPGKEESSWWAVLFSEKPVLSCERKPLSGSMLSFCTRRKAFPYLQYSEMRVMSSSSGRSS